MNFEILQGKIEGQFPACLVTLSDVCERELRAIKAADRPCRGGFCPCRDETGGEALIRDYALFTRKKTPLSLFRKAIRIITALVVALMGMRSNFSWDIYIAHLPKQLSH